MNTVMCSLCRSRDHTIRDCERAVCHHCNKKGHLKRDCRQYRTVEKIRVHFPHHITVCAAVSPAPLRRIPNLGTILRKLPEIEDTVERSNQFWSTANRFNIDYGNRDEILISLLNGVDRAETKIHVSPARIKIASRYSIMNHELYEDGTREASNSLDEDDTPGPIQVVLVAKEVFESTVCLQVNESKYYLEWLPNREIAVQSAHVYSLRKGPPPRRPVTNLAEYFVGPSDKRQKPNETDTKPITQEITVKSDEEPIDEEENAGPRVEYIITVEAESSTIEENPQTAYTVEPNQAVQPSVASEERNESAEGSVTSDETVRLMEQQIAVPESHITVNIDSESHDSTSDCEIVET